MDDKGKELILYIAVNKDLNMSPGKVAAQVGHLCTDIAMHLSSYQIPADERFAQWYEWYDQKKIILSAHEKVLQKVVQENGFYVRDIGCNEIPADSVTVASLGIMTREEVPNKVKRLQTYKG